jgi:prepilin-type N-terminal cleavage/methylation domain-containing protein/prepilin-type processing-associated H-X9-DG protein
MRDCKVVRGSASGDRESMRRAFTLVELLVVIAIIGTLVGLLLPAVQTARESARRSTCSSSLRQIALGVINYHDARRRFPPGAVQSDMNCIPLDYNASPPTVRRASWTVWVLPYIEETRMYDSFNPSSASTRFGCLLTGTSGEDSTNLAAQNTPLSIYKCPSDIAQRAAEPSLNYFGVQGGGAEANALCQNGSASNYRLRFDNGILITRLSTETAIRASDVTDGLSKTFLVGESRWWLYNYTNVVGTGYLSWSSSNRVAGGNAHTAVLAAAVDPLNNAIVDYDASQAWGTVASNTNPLYLGTHTRCFGSRHPGGCHMAMADGSVQFVSNSISTTIYRQLGTRADGQPMGAIE